MATLESLKLFFERHDPNELFGTSNPTDEDLNEFLSETPEQDLLEMLTETYGETLEASEPRFSSAGGMPLGPRNSFLRGPADFVVVIPGERIDMAVAWDPEVCAEYPLYFSSNQHDPFAASAEEQRQRDWLVYGEGKEGQGYGTVAVLVAVEGRDLHGYGSFEAVEELLMETPRPMRLTWRRVTPRSDCAPEQLVQANKLKVEVWDHDMVGSGDFLGQAVLTCKNSKDHHGNPPPAAGAAGAASGFAGVAASALAAVKLRRKASGLSRLTSKADEAAAVGAVGLSPGSAGADEEAGRFHRGTEDNDHGLLEQIGEHVLPLVGRPGGGKENKFVKQGAR